MSDTKQTFIARPRRGNPRRERLRQSGIPKVLLVAFVLGSALGQGLLGPGAFAASPDAEPVPAPFVSSGLVESHVAMAALKYKAGEYLEAANELNLAYSLQPQPVFLFNIAQAYRKGRASRAAKEMYQRFVEVAPTHPLAPEARGYIQDMEALERAEVQNQVMRRQLELDLQRQAERRAIYKRPWFWGVIGAAVGVTAIAIGVGVGLSQREPQTLGGFVDLRF